jgi:hypothetical protein
MWCLALLLGFWRDAPAKCNPRRFLLHPNRQRLSVNNNKAVLRSPDAKVRGLYARLTSLTPPPKHPSSSISRAEGNTEAANHHHRATPLSTSYILYWIYSVIAAITHYYTQLLSFSWNISAHAPRMYRYAALTRNKVLVISPNSVLNIIDSSLSPPG